MVGKPNFPADVETRDDIKGAASPTPGLGALDQEREASMADEGGASGAIAEDPDTDLPFALGDEDDELEYEVELTIDPRALLVGAAALLVCAFLVFRSRD
jgi:hypothetical protein